MCTTSNFNGIRAFAARHCLLTLISLTVCAISFAAIAAMPTQTEVNSSGSHCTVDFDPKARYPSLPDSNGVDVNGEAGVVLFLQEHRGVVHIDGCFYELDRPLQIDFAGLDEINLLLELPDNEAGAQVFVSEDGAAREFLDVQADAFTYPQSAGEALGFELLADDQAAPTVPVVVTKPVEDDPDPD